MRSRPLTAAAAAFVLALSAASCGGDDDSSAEVVAPTSGDIVTTSSPVQPGSTPQESSPTDTPAGSGDDATKTDGGSGDGLETKPNSPERVPSGDLIPVVATKSTDLTNFTTALGAAGLTETLGENGPYTVFAPNNDGFAKLGTRLDTLLQPAAKAELVNILSFHVVKGEFDAKDLKDGKLLTTLQGTRLRVTKEGDTLQVGNTLGKSQIVSTDLKAGNGVIHVIDTVLTPKTN